MGSISITDLLGAYSAADFGIVPGSSGDVGALINTALIEIAAMSPANGALFFRPGTYRIQTPINLVSSVEIVGFGSATVFRLDNSLNVDVVTGSGVSNVRLRNFRIDGNRANNTSGTRQGLWLNNVTDAWIENVEAVSCRADGFRLDNCVRVEMVGCKASDNGRHGFSLANCEFCQLVSPRSYDNSQVSSAGTGDGINLELLTRDTSIVCPLCYETALVGDRQGYGVREAAGEGCARNLVIGGALRGNRTGGISLDSGDSAALTLPLIQIPGGLTITP